jgi:hypothetical protein
LVNKFPYTDTNDNDLVVRTFSENIDPIDLMWHRDLKTRRIKVISGQGWKIQLENSLPEDINDITIKKLEWHRVIKGSGDLVVSIEEFD